MNNDYNEVEIWEEVFEKQRQEGKTDKEIIEDLKEQERIYESL